MVDQIDEMIELYENLASVKIVSPEIIQVIMDNLQAEWPKNKLPYNFKNLIETVSVLSMEARVKTTITPLTLREKIARAA